MVFYITTFSTVCSIIYNYATGSSNTVIYLNSGILLFLNSIDDQFLLILTKIKPDWVDAIEMQIAENDFASSLSVNDNKRSGRKGNSCKSKSVPSQIAPNSIKSSSSDSSDSDNGKMSRELKDLKKKHKLSMEKINSLESSKHILENECVQLRKDYAEMKQIVDKLSSRY